MLWKEFWKTEEDADANGHNRGDGHRPGSPEGSEGDVIDADVRIDGDQSENEPNESEAATQQPGLGQVDPETNTYRFFQTSI